jgi:capsular exopolysaccharide synthesis family protein
MEGVEKRDPMPVSQPAPELRAYLATLWRRKWYILAVLGVVVPTALFYSSRQTPLYESTAEVLVRPVNFDPTQPTSEGGFINLLTEERVAGSAAVASLASDRLGGSIPASIGVSSVEGTQSLLFRAVSADPAAAQTTAQAFAKAYLDHRRGEVLADLDAASQPLHDRIEQIDLQLQDVQRKLLEENPSESEKTSLQIQFNSLLTQRGSLEQRLNELVLPENISVGEILQDAPFPYGPFSPDRRRTLIFAVFVGLSLGIGIAFLRDRLDRGIRGRDDLEEHVGAPALGIIPRFGSRFRGRPRLLTMSDPDSGVSEAFRALGTSVLKSAGELRAKSVMVTSAKEGEGKTLTVANLGVALAQAGKRVVLVSADMQRPMLESYFYASNGTGLTDVLSGRKRAVHALSKVAIGNLRVLPTGPIPPSTDSVLNPESMSDVLSQCEESADLVLIDSAPLLGKSDPIALAIAADAIVVVADAQRAERLALDEVRRLLDRIGTPVIGSVLTNSDRSSYPYYGPSRHYGRSRRWMVAKAANSKGKRADLADKSPPPG